MQREQEEATLAGGKLAVRGSGTEKRAADLEVAVGMAWGLKGLISFSLRC